MGFEIQQRDIKIIRYVGSHRLLRSRSHVLPLFGGSKHLLRRLKKLYDHKYLCRLPGRKAHQEAIYAIGNKGSDLLHRKFGRPRPRVDWTQQNRRLGVRFIEHTLLVSDIMVALELACRGRENVSFISQEDMLAERVPEATRKEHRKVGGRPLRWPVKFRHQGQTFRKSIEPDRMFALTCPDGRIEPFFLEADRQTMPVRSQNMNRSSLFKKQLQYRASWKKGAGNSKNLLARRFGIADLRVLFVLATGYEGSDRLKRCLEVNRHFNDGAGTGLFLFVNKETLLDTEDILTAPLISGRGNVKMLIG